MDGNATNEGVFGGAPFGTDLGVAQGAAVVLNPTDDLTAGQRVRVAQ